MDPNRNGFDFEKVWVSKGLGFEKFGFERFWFREGLLASLGSVRFQSSGPLSPSRCQLKPLKPLKPLSPSF
jgi:hypothetical protein